MSFYATIQGTIKYKSQDGFNKAYKMLQDGQWINNKNQFVDEDNNKLTQHANVNRTNKTIEIPLGLYRNFAGHLDELIQDSSNMIVWTSMDGCFSGGIIRNGRETEYDLNEWAKDNVLRKGQSPPDPTQDTIKRCVDYMNEIQLLFMENHQHEIH